MSEQLQKLTPDRDLQCYFLLPSAVAAMSNASDSGFTVSGTWRQQFDWAVVEWNRDNTFDHPALRNLPDGDLSGLLLSYEEQRSGCIPFESNLVPTVEWDSIRLWTDDSGANPYTISLRPGRAVAISGAYTPATATMTVAQVPSAGTRVGLCLLETHYYYSVQSGDSASQIAAGVAAAFSGDGRFQVSSSGPSVTVSFIQATSHPEILGANGNRQSVYGFTQGGSSCWATASSVFQGGAFPDRYRVTIDFGQLKASGIPTDRVRKLRWTWAADIQNQNFVKTEFSVAITNWTVTGTNRTQMVAGPGSRRIEDANPSLVYTGPWTAQKGNYSGGSIRTSAAVASSVEITYSESSSHALYLGTRWTGSNAPLQVAINGGAPITIALSTPGEDILVRRLLANLPAGTATVNIMHDGSDGQTAWFDFIEIVYPTAELPSVDNGAVLALATDWDTYHSQSLPAERTAWMIQQLGFGGRVNHYVGAMWFYELIRPGMRYASSTLSLSQTSFVANDVLAASITPVGGVLTVVQHLVLADDTADSAALALAALINAGTNLVWASVSGAQLTITARAMGTAGNDTLVSITSQSFVVSPMSSALTGGVDGDPYPSNQNDSASLTLFATTDYWRIDLNASPRLNRATRDWHSAYFKALQSYGLEAVASFSTELAHIDPSLSVGMAQRYADGTAVVVNTPAVQTNFSPAALAYWQEVYGEMAAIQAHAGLQPFLQFGEVQWWYYPQTNGSMSFYDAYTSSAFVAQTNQQLPLILSNDADVIQYAPVIAFLNQTLGNYTTVIASYVKSTVPNCKFEVLFPVDTNATAFKLGINYASVWTPAAIDSLKTESLSYTASFDLSGCESAIAFPLQKGFSPGSSAHLVGIGDPQTAWLRETQAAQSAGMRSVVLFALDQYCLAGMPLLPFARESRSAKQG